MALCASYHPDFSAPTADIILQSSGGTRYRMYSLVLRLASGFFRDALSLPQPSYDAGYASDSSSDDENGGPIVMAEDDETVHALLTMIQPGMSIPPLTSIDLVQRILDAADKYEMPTPISIICARITAPEFMAHPLQVYAWACRFGWAKERMLASTHTLHLNLYDPSYAHVLESLDTRDLLVLFQFHRARRDRLRAAIASLRLEQLGDPDYGLLCGHFSSKIHEWEALQARIFAVMDNNPSGETLKGRHMLEWPEAQACWSVSCACCPYSGTSRCGYKPFHKTRTLVAIEKCIDDLPNSVY